MSKRSLPTTPTQSNTMWKYLKPLKKKCKLGDTEDSSESQSLEIQSATVSPSSSTVEVRKNGGALAQATPGPSAIIISRASSTSNLGTPREKKALNKRTAKRVLLMESQAKKMKNLRIPRAKRRTSKKGTPVKETSKSMPKINPNTDLVKDIHSSWVHNDLPFLRPDKIKDNKGRHSSDPNYDSTTLFVPESFLNNQTPAMRQWWELKSKLYGFFGDFAHSGFPESAYAKMASALIEKGFKVARFDKVVKREICQVTTKATCVYTAQMPEARNDKPYFMYAICMKSYAADKVRFGVCAVETSICQFYLSEFVDDKHFSRLLVLFSEYPPAQILYERGGVNKKIF
ncbi:hypothetical protein NQ317_006142 [Molorchus minor]|uniref:Uncharacterized protein n=1 Tax=Molorchus minor TaxID=1323400 RepID=A0ABQ9K3B2_9CUCU|nr:hypothetical protein NQ317_006142 [Molorchus minor]